jgi:homoserine dehydrogenase
VLSDLSALSYDYRYEYKKLNPIESLAYDSAVFLKVLLRHPFSGDEYREYFEEIQEAYLNHTSGFIIGILSLENLKKIIGRNKHTSVVLFEPADYERKKDAVENRHEYLLN